MLNSQEEQARDQNLGCAIILQCPDSRSMRPMAEELRAETSRIKTTPSIHSFDSNDETPWHLDCQQHARRKQWDERPSKLPRKQKPAQCVSNIGNHCAMNRVQNNLSFQKQGLDNRQD